MLGLPPDTTSEPSKKFTIPFTVFVGLLLASGYAEPLEMAEKGREAADSLMNGEETDDASTGESSSTRCGITQRRRLIWEKECQWNNLRKAI